VARAHGRLLNALSLRAGRRGSLRRDQSAPPRKVLLAPDAFALLSVLTAAWLLARCSMVSSKAWCSNAGGTTENLRDNLTKHRKATLRGAFMEERQGTAARQAPIAGDLASLSGQPLRREAVRMGAAFFRFDTCAVSTRRPAPQQACGASSRCGRSKRRGKGDLRSAAPLAVVPLGGAGGELTCSFRVAAGPPPVLWRRRTRNSACSCEPGRRRAHPMPTGASHAKVATQGGTALDRRTSWLGRQWLSSHSCSKTEGMVLKRTGRARRRRRGWHPRLARWRCSACSPRRAASSSRLQTSSATLRTAARPKQSPRVSPRRMNRRPLGVATLTARF